VRAQGRSHTQGAPRRRQGERSPRRAHASRERARSLSAAGAPARQAAAVGPHAPQNPSTHPLDHRARSRTLKPERRERRVLLERGRQSCRAGIADVVICGGAAPTTRSPTLGQRRHSKGGARAHRVACTRAALPDAGRASAARGARTHRAKGRARFPQRARLRRRKRPRAHKPPNPPTPPRATEHARAHSSSSDVTVVFFRSAAARAVAPAAPMSLSAAAQHPRRDPRPWVSGAIQKAERARTGSLAHARPPRRRQGERSPRRAHASRENALAFRSGRACAAGRGLWPSNTRATEHARALVRLTIRAPSRIACSAPSIATNSLLARTPNWRCAERTSLLTARTRLESK
jgi:hypothetical protein